MEIALYAIQSQEKSKVPIPDNITFQKMCADLDVELWKGMEIAKWANRHCQVALKELWREDEQGGGEMIVEVNIVAIIITYEDMLEIDD